jgi:hypothetical protein
MGLLNQQAPSESFYYNAIAGVGSMRGITMSQYVQCMRELYSNHSLWVLDPKRRFILSHLQERCLYVAVYALAALSNSIAYTSDISEVQQEEIITEQYIIDLCEVRAGDCEDVAAYIYRLWVSLVRKRWDSDVVSCTARVLNLYIGTVNVTMSRECHILTTLKLREHSYRSLVRGAIVHYRGTPNEHNKEKMGRVMRGIERTVFWPEYMYDAGVQARHDASHCTSELFVPSFLPAVLVAEGTRVTPPDVTADDFILCHESKHHRSSIERQHLAVDRIKHLPDEEARQLLQTLEPALSGCNAGVTLEQTRSEPLKLSDFYQGFICECFLPPPLVLMRQEFEQCASAGSGLQSPRADAELRDADYFVCGMYTDSRHPKTFGVYHTDVVHGNNLCGVIPYAKPSRALLAAFETVMRAEPPVLPPTLPLEMQRLPLDQLGRPQPMPQLKRMEKLQPLLHAAAHLTAEQRRDPTLVKLRFFPHDGNLRPEYMERLVERFGSRLVALDGMRLALARPIAAEFPLTTAMRQKVEQFQREFNVAEFDPAEYQFLLAQMTDGDVRHHFGALYRQRPLWYNYVRMWVRV